MVELYLVDVEGSASSIPRSEIVKDLGSRGAIGLGFHPQGWYGRLAAR